MLHGFIIDLRALYYGFQGLFLHFVLNISGLCKIVVNTTASSVSASACVTVMQGKLPFARP